MEQISLFFFVEEPSIEPVIKKLMKIIDKSIFYQVFIHQGKQDLELTLPKTIPSVSRVPNSRIIILRDQDKDDCLLVKKNLIEKVSLVCCSPFKIRIVCRELESWFLGDMNAIQTAFPRFNSKKYVNKAQFRNVDSIIKPNQILFRIIPELNEGTYISKRKLSEKISNYLCIENNKSTSFNNFVKAVNLLLTNN